MAHVFVIGALAGSIVGAFDSHSPRSSPPSHDTFPLRDSSPSRKRQWMERGRVRTTTRIHPHPSTHHGITKPESFPHIHYMPIFPR